MALRLRAWVRRQVRRLGSARGFLVGLVGLLAVAGWVSMLLWSRSGRPEADPEALGFLYLSLGAFLLLAGLEVEGLYLPEEELDRLLSAPVTRADLVRYRYVLSVGRMPFTVGVLSLVASGWAPRWELLALGLALYLALLTALAQLVGRLVGGLQQVSSLLRWMPFRLVRRVGMVAVFLVVSGGMGLLAVESGPAAQLRAAVHGLVALVRPWVELSVAERLRPGLALAGLLSVVGVVELSARLPLDFRESAVVTSTRIHRRVRRVREGRSGLDEASVGALGIPWWAGRGPFGAIVWLQSARLVRNAGRTLTVSVLVSVLILVGLTTAVGPVSGLALRTAMTYGLVLLGTFYLCSALRADFRSLLERMDVVRAWPVDRGLVFLAVLLPQAALVVLLMVGTVGGWLLVRGEANLYLLLSLPLLPPLVIGLLGVDNIVFLLAPYRVVPGQDALFYQVGRSFLVAMLRLVVFSAMGGLLGGAMALAVAVGRGLLGWSTVVSAGLGALAGLALLPAVDLAVVLVGAWALQRYDPSRQPG